MFYSFYSYRTLHYTHRTASQSSITGDCCPLACRSGTAPPAAFTLTQKNKCLHLLFLDTDCYSNAVNLVMVPKIKFKVQTNQSHLKML